ncbi:MAG: D-2-hydroxyacid dehydrogenase [Bacteroidaceae bacterium]|nr:D-2-hydroxyacid dehydrogenase [Bacteroidaceae bacterium]
MKIAILDGYSVIQHDLNWQNLKTELSKSCPDVEVTAYDRTRPEETLDRCQDAEAVLTNKVVLTAELLTALPHLRYIGVLATGYNVVDCAAARQRGVVVTNIPAYSTDSVAQLVFAHLLNVTNSVAHYAENRQRWPSTPDFTWSDTPLTELTGKTLGIFGLGNIGSAVARIALAFGMKVLAVTSRPPEILPVGVEKAEWETVLQKADVLSLHCPLTPNTREMINATTLACMKPTAILINTGRGPLVNEEAVATALQQNRLAAYCADVLSTEPPATNNPLLSAPRCYMTPHIAWATREARQRLITIATQNLVAFMNGQPIHVVN